VLLGIAQGMVYIHQNRIVHGELKPCNVLFKVRFKFQKFLGTVYAQTYSMRQLRLV
jgi:hypothetical protein